jgi:putative ATP-dependent endonuclease of OLD family
MIISKLKIQNYKLFKEKIIEFNDEINILVGNNDSGKSTILEAVSIVTTGKINRIYIDKFISASFFNNDVRNEYIKALSLKEYIAPPEIIIEAYCKDDPILNNHKGTNNSLGEDCCGITFSYEFDHEQYASIYKEQLIHGDINDIPIEYYKINFKSFNGDNNLQLRNLPFKVLMIDTSKKDYSNLVNGFIDNNISELLSEEDQVNLKSEYRRNQQNFKTLPAITNLNKKLHDNVKINNKTVSINVKDNNLNKWKDEMSVSVDDIPFENIGFGTQNSIKIELALSNNKEKVNTILIEEPENNLSYSNMNKLVSNIEENNNDKQLFISSHSSFIANKLGLGNILLVNNGNVSSLNSLNDETKSYFTKLPGFDTLRLILANKVILVEGPADDLIIQRAYKDKHNKLPINDGVDIISVNALAFKRYCDIALLVNKNIIIVTDNDGNIKENIIDKYKNYINKDTIKICYENDESLVTLEPSILSSNSKTEEQLNNFKKIISKNNSMINKNKEEILKFMKNNKTEWSMRVFDSELSIEYPQYIKDAIE